MNATDPGRSSHREAIASDGTGREPRAVLGAVSIESQTGIPQVLRQFLRCDGVPGKLVRPCLITDVVVDDDVHSVSLSKHGAHHASAVGHPVAVHIFSGPNV